MPSKYGKEFAVPAEFPSVLKSFTREVLRAQPNNIYEFGATYFTELLSQAEAAAAAEAAGANKRLSRAELEELLTSMFQEADTDESGALSLTEFKQVLSMADLGLSDHDAKTLYAEADVDDSGEISYSEFVPLAVELVYSIYDRQDEDEADEMLQADAREEAENLLHKGMTKEQVEGIMRDIFQKSDVDGSGALSIAEFQKCCKDADIGLTRKEVNVLMHQCDVDGDGMISYDEFVPLCFEMLVEITTSNLLKNKKPASELQSFIFDLCSQEDSAGEGMLPLQTIKEIIWNADFGLSRVQLHSIGSAAEHDGDGLVAYREFASKAASLLYRMLDLDAQRDRMQAIAGLEIGDINLVHGFTADDIKIAFQELFAAADPTNSGTVPTKDLQRILSGSALGLSDIEIRAIMNAAEVLDGGVVNYYSIVSYGFYILQFMAQEAAIAAQGGAY